MTILEKLTKVTADISALEAKKKVLTDEISQITTELEAAYGADWEQKYTEEVKKLEAWDDSTTA